LSRQEQSPSSDPAPGEVTKLLGRINVGQQDALGELLPLVYRDLRRVAARHLASENAAHTLQPTALVHEVYFRLVDQRERSWQNRVQFFAVAAQLMRRVLLDHARRRKALKRGGAMATVHVEDCVAISDDRLLDMLIFDELLTRLASVDPVQARMVELRFFAGLSVEETASAMKVSSATVKRDWRSARAWLLKGMSKAKRGDTGAVAAG
jgi:RNA polymerase sigma factor (TIGR02999 family)